MFDSGYARELRKLANQLTEELVRLAFLSAQLPTEESNFERTGNSSQRFLIRDSQILFFTALEQLKKEKNIPKERRQDRIPPILPPPLDQGVAGNRRIDVPAQYYNRSQMYTRLMQEEAIRNAELLPVTEATGESGSNGNGHPPQPVEESKEPEADLQPGEEIQGTGVHRIIITPPLIREPEVVRPPEDLFEPDRGLTGPEGPHMTARATSPKLESKVLKKVKNFFSFKKSDSKDPK